MIAFLIFALIGLGSAVMVVASRNPVVSALWLAVTLAATAGIFVLLGAEFLAVMQLIIYAGAVMVFFLFVVMLLNLGKLEPGEEAHPYQHYLGLFGALALGLLLLLSMRVAAPGMAAPVGFEGARDNTQAIALEVFTVYPAPLEFMSVVLLIAMVGAVVLAQRRF